MNNENENGKNDENYAILTDWILTIENRFHPEKFQG